MAVGTALRGLSMEQINYKLEVFEGPMDLLLSLISKHKLDIYDIPIMELVEQYTDYVRRMQEADMEVASEFLEMAARLVYIKTVSLLPKSEEAEELKRELTGELLEYRDCQIMAGKLKDTANGFELYTKGPDEVEADMTYENPRALRTAVRLPGGHRKTGTQAPAAGGGLHRDRPEKDRLGPVPDQLYLNEYHRTGETDVLLAHPGLAIPFRNGGHLPCAARTHSRQEGRRFRGRR